MPPRIATRAGGSGARRLGLVLLGVVLGLLAFELAAQAVFWSLRPRTPSLHASGSAESVVLCVGDSNTFGMGASTADGPYPAQLGRLLEDAEPGRWSVVNGGRPGLNSEEIVRGLPMLLERYRPRVVYALVGTNDVWSHAEPVLDSDWGRPEPFPIRWRTGRLLALFARWLSQPSEAAARARQAPFVGHWHDAAGGTEIHLAADGACRIGLTEAAWTEDGDDLLLTMPDSKVVRTTWRLDGQRLQLRIGNGPPLVLTPGPAPQQHNPFFVPTENMLPSDPGFAAAFAEACQEIEAAPTDLRQWARLTAMQLEPEHWRQLEQILRKAIDDAPHAALQARLFRGLCFLPKAAPRQRLGWALEATRLDGKGLPVVNLLRQSAPPIAREEYDQLVAELETDAATRAKLATLYDESLGEHHRDYADVLEQNLRQLVAWCRRVGAEPVLLDYPSHIAEVDAVVTKLHEELRVDRVYVSAEFARALRTTRQEALFVEDGHCNDVGYGMMARLVLQDLQHRAERDAPR
ncbi:MAG: SGNH/GDSL hydrolase family protein [Planctomycetota bacterium]